jgi:hypothetical protein
MAKGGRFEILIAKKLTKWVTGKEKPEIVWRSVSLGPKATMDRRRGGTIRKIGDLVAIDPKGQWIEDTFFIECKHHKEANLMDLFELRPTKSKSNVLNWWKKASGEALEARKEPFLIFKGNNRPIMLMCLKRLYNSLEITPKVVLKYKINNESIIIFLFEEFLQLTDSEIIKNKFMEKK